MGLKKIALLLTPLFIASCGGEGNFGSGFVGEFNTVILYVTSVNPQPLQSDIVQHIPVAVSVNAVDPTVEIIGDGIGNDNGICEPGEVCCGDIGPGNPVFQTQCCTATIQVDLCTGIQFEDDNIQVGFMVESKKDFAGQPVFTNTSPVIIESVDIVFKNHSSDCPDIPSRSEHVNMTVQPDTDISTFALSLISQSLKSYLFSLGAVLDIVNYTNADGCITPIQVAVFPYFCEYTADLRFHAIEIFGGDTETISVSVSVRIADFQSQGECQF